MIRQYPDSCLTSVCTVFAQDEIMLGVEVGNKLLEALANYKRAGVGLAAPQIGVTRRVFVLDSKYLEIKCGPIFINPTIMWSARDTDAENEGCLSFPEDVVVEVRRPVSISLCYDTLDREGVMVELHGLAARAAQHECDHLDGLLINRFLSRQQRRKLDRRLKTTTTDTE